MKYIVFILFALVGYIHATKHDKTTTLTDPKAVFTSALLYVSLALEYSGDQWSAWAQRIYNAPNINELSKYMRANVGVIYKATCALDVTLIEVNAALLANSDKKHRLIMCDPQRLLCALQNLGTAQKCWGEALKQWICGPPASSDATCEQWFCALEKVIKSKSCLAQTLGVTKGDYGVAFGLACQATGINQYLEGLACAINDGAVATLAQTCHVDAHIVKCLEISAGLLKSLSQVELDIDRSLCAMAKH